MGSAQSHEGGDEADIPRDLDSDVREMYAIGEPASGTPSQSGGSGSKRSRRQTRHASAKSAAKSKGSYAAVRKTRRR